MSAYREESYVRILALSPVLAGQLGGLLRVGRKRSVRSFIPPNEERHPRERQEDERFYEDVNDEGLKNVFLRCHGFPTNCVSTIDHF